MRHLAKAICILALLPWPASAAQAPDYTDDNRINIPANYREWVFLTSSLDLNYDQATPAAGHISVLDNVFVNPEAYKAFLETGTWPDKTMLVKENRFAESAGTISKSGKFQGDIASMELHVKDTARFPGSGWAFFVSRRKAPGRQIPQTADCYSCHGDHGAVDTTFVQFYPTLLEVAKTKGTLSAGYLKDKPPQ